MTTTNYQAFADDCNNGNSTPPDQDKNPDECDDCNFKHAPTSIPGNKKEEIELVPMTIFEGHENKKALFSLRYFLIQVDLVVAFFALYFQRLWNYL